MRRIDSGQEFAGITAWAQELAKDWLGIYMLESDGDDSRIGKITDFFTDVDERKSHARTIGCAQAAHLGVKVLPIEEDQPGLADLVRSLFNQYACFLVGRTTEGGESGDDSMEADPAHGSDYWGGDNGHGDDAYHAPAAPAASRVLL